VGDANVYQHRWSYFSRFALCIDVYIGSKEMNKTYMCTGELMESYKSGAGFQKSVFGKLTSRQREVLQLLAEGKSAKEVAKILNISARTVEFHKYYIMEELGIKTSAELVQFAIKHGIISI
jgi:NarL family two-component system response regulator LiaR